MFDLDALLKEPNEFRICDKCKGTNADTLGKKLKELDSKAHLLVGCQSYCGPGRDRPFVFVNGKPLVADNEDALIEKVKEFLA